MFTPLALKRNRIEELDRFDNTPVTADTGGKVGGYYQTDSNYWGFHNGTVIVQAWPNADDLRYTGTSGNRFKWMFFNIENNSQAAWWSLCVATDDNIQIGAGSDYSLLDNTDGWKKGQFGVQTRFRSSGNADGLILIDSGSFYDWTDPQPIHIAYVNDQINSQFRASINGETKAVVAEPRSGREADWNDYYFWGDLGTTDSNDLSFGYSPEDFTEILMSGSYYEFQFYTESLSQEEINLITSQPYGTPGNVLDKQPHVHYRFTEEYKTGLEFPNIGTDTGFTKTFETRFETANQITSGSVYDYGIKDYRGRI